MARIRSIKPEFWTSEQISLCSLSARLAFIALWTFCDDAGRHPASLARFKMEAFPADSMTTDEIAVWIGELVNANLVEEYEVKGAKFWQVTGWHHQKIDQPTYRHPAPNGRLPKSPNKRRTFAEHSASAHPGRGGEGKGEEWSGVSSHKLRSSLNGKSLIGSKGSDPDPDLQVDWARAEMEARKIAKDIPVKNKEDRATLLKLAALMQGGLSENCVQGAVESTVKNAKNGRWGYFWNALRGRAKELHGVTSIESLMVVLVIPPEVLNA